MPEYRFIEPLDTIFPRGNNLFGGSGDHGEALMPPWPSVAAGALRSRMLADADADFVSFSRGVALSDPALNAALGTPADPGAFRIVWFSPGRWSNGHAEPLSSLPSDLATTEDEETINYLNPQPPPKSLRCSASTGKLAVLRQQKVVKPQTGLWLNGAGIEAYLRGQQLNKKTHAVATGKLWKIDPRIGIALDPEKRSAGEGQIYTADGVALCDRVGFIVGMSGADGQVPRDGLLRFGGDGRGARIAACDRVSPEPDWKRIGEEKRFRIVMATPGLFEKGWHPAGIQPDGITWNGPDGTAARLVCAAVARAQVVSGWDLAKHCPKAALRAVPPGSVYWFEQFSGDVSALKKLVAEGFGCIKGYPDRARIVEGFNNVLVANWGESAV